MTRSRKLQVTLANYVRKPIYAAFSIIPKYYVHVLLRTFRWSETFIGYGIRYLCVKRLAKSCGEKVLIFPGCILHWLENCDIGENVTFHDFCYIDALGGVRIGDNTRIAHNCSIISAQHGFDVPGKLLVDSGYTCAKITIKSDVWLATGVVVMQGISIGEGAIVGANSVVTKDVEPYTIVAGVPTKFIKNRFETTPDNSCANNQAV